MFSSTTSLLPQNKIAGTQIAWGRGTWGEIEDGRSGYLFDKDDAFQYVVPQQWLAGNSVSEDDLTDCLTQIEKEVGEPEEFRRGLGLIPGGGFTHPGIVVRSRTNDEVVCVFTPTSFQPDFLNGKVDGYFEWFLDKKGADTADLSTWMKQFDAMSGNRLDNITASPVVPVYGEAVEVTAKSDVLSEAERDWFLRKVWQYQKGGCPKGTKSRLAEEILVTWKRVLGESEVVEADPSLQPPKKWFEKMLGQVEGDDKPAIVGAIWRDLSDEKKAEIRAREGKTYAPAKSESVAPQLKKKLTSLPTSEVARMLHAKEISDSDVEDTFGEFSAKLDRIYDAVSKLELSGDTYTYVVDKDERGEFAAHVEDHGGKVVWEASSDDDEDGAFWPVTDGFMKHEQDVDGLEKYLKQMHVIPASANLTK